MWFIQKKYLNNYEASRNEDNEGHREEARKVTQQTRVTVEFRRQGGDGEEEGRIHYALEK